MGEQHESRIDVLEADFMEKMNPVIDRLLDEMEILPPPPDPIRPAPSAEQLRTDKRKEIEQSAFSRVEYRRLLRGRELIIDRLDATPHPDICRAEVLSAFDKLAAIAADHSELIDELIVREEIGEGENVNINETDAEEFWSHFKTLREELNISEQTYAELYGIGINSYRNRDIEDAASIYRFLTVLNVTCFEAWYTFGLCLKELGEFEDAIQAFLTAVSTDGREPAAYLQLSHLYFLKGDQSTADAIIELGSTNMKELGVESKVLQEWEQISKKYVTSA